TGPEWPKVGVLIASRTGMTVCRTRQCVTAHYYTAMATPNDPYRCYALAARRHARHLSRLYDRWLAPAGLSVSQLSILALLDAHGKLKITELADRLSMERTSLVRALNPLQTAGWVVAERPASGRSFDVKLSGRGHKKLAQAMPLWRSA